jgi:P pilus assembly chaperone PapD
MKRFSLLSLFLTICSLSFSQKFAIQPGILHYQLEPGKAQSQVVRITNTSDEKITFQAYLGDWLRDSTGGHEYYRADTLSQSCASWVKLNKNFIEIAPRKTEELMIVLRGPAEPNLYNKMRWAMLFLQSVQEKDSARGKSKVVKTEIKEVMRVGIHIYQTPPSVIKAAAQAVSLKKVDSSYNKYAFSVANSGQVMLQCKASLTLTAIESGQEFKLDKVEFPMFPAGKRSVNFEVPSTIPKGKYSALAVLDIGEDETLQAIEKTIQIK